MWFVPQSTYLQFKLIPIYVYLILYCLESRIILFSIGLSNIIIYFIVWCKWDFRMLMWNYKVWWMNNNKIWCNIFLLLTKTDSTELNELIL